VEIYGQEIPTPISGLSNNTSQPFDELIGDFDFE
jgi:hypothetical protein